MTGTIRVLSVEGGMRRQWTEEEARGFLAAWRKSGLSIEKFAKECGLVPQRVRWWKKKFEEQPEPKAKAGSMALLPVRVTASPAPAAPKRGEPISVYLRGGQVVRVGRGFDEEAFARVVAILEGA